MNLNFRLCYIMWFVWLLLRHEHFLYVEIQLVCDKVRFSLLKLMSIYVVVLLPNLPMISTKHKNVTKKLIFDMYTSSPWFPFDWLQIEKLERKRNHLATILLIIIRREDAVCFSRGHVTIVQIMLLQHQVLAVWNATLPGLNVLSSY